MSTLQHDETIRARWTVGPLPLRAFADRVRAQYQTFPPEDLLKACASSPLSGVEVVCRDDAVFVGRWHLAFLYNNISDIRLGEDCMLFVMEEGQYDIPIPVGPDNRAEAARMVEYYVRKGREESRRSFEERHAPTWNNRLLDLAEAHFVWLVIGLFFVVLPLGVFLMSLVHGSAH